MSPTEQRDAKRKIHKLLEFRKKTLGELRDALRNDLDDLGELLENTESAYVELESVIETLSRLV